MSHDPYTAKAEYTRPLTEMAGTSNPVVNAQPVPQTTPVQPREVQMTPPQQLNIQTYSPRPPPNRWKDSICDWPNNLFPSCWCVCCWFYGMYLVAQMAEKVQCATFRGTIWATVAVWFLCFILSLFVAGGIIIWVPIVFSLIFSIALRLHIVRRDNITECGAQPMIGECCCGFWCWYCSVAQMARHVYGYDKVWDGDGDPYRADNYGPAHQV